MIPLYKIKNWSTIYENNRTRELKRLDWVPIPNRHDGEGYTLAAGEPDGPALLGAWLVIIQVASRCDPRGTLLRDTGIPHNCASIARLSRFPEEVIKRALDFFSGPEMQWLEIEWVQEVTKNVATGCDNPAAKCGNPASGCPEWNGMEWNGREEKRIEDSVAAQRPAARGKGRGRKKPSVGNPNHKPLVEFFCQSWEERFGAKYHFQNGKDAAAATTILKATGNDLEASSRVVTRYLGDDDKFLNDNGHTLALLASRINAYLANLPDDDDEPMTEERWNEIVEISKQPKTPMELAIERGEGLAAFLPPENIENGQP